MMKKESNQVEREKYCREQAKIYNQYFNTATSVTGAASLLAITNAAKLGASPGGVAAASTASACCILHGGLVALRQFAMDPYEQCMSKDQDSIDSTNASRLNRR